MKTCQPMMFGSPAGRSTETPRRRDGFYLCSHCHQQLTPSQTQIEIAANAPEANPALKCSHCHKHAVHWVPPVSPKTKMRFQPVSDEAGRMFFAGIFRMLAEI